MGIREQLRSLRRQVHEDMDYLVLKDGTRYYFDPEQDPPALFFEMMRKSYLSSEVEIPEIRKALKKATPESLSRFEEKYQLPVTQEVNVVQAGDRLIVRRIELDGTVRSFLLEGEAAKERLAASRAGRRERPPLDPNREGVREIDPEEEPELLEVEDLSSG